MKARDYPALAEVLREAWARSAEPRYAAHIADRWEFMARALIAVDAATRRRRPRYRLRKPRLPKRLAVPPKVQAREFRPVVEAVAREHGIPYDVLVGPRQDLTIARIRYEAMWMIRHLPRPVPPSYPVIAAAVGRDNHTTAMAGVRLFEARLTTDLVLRARVLGEQRERRAA
jgi:chromosomal replication initiation ATPase DnaA